MANRLAEIFTRYAACVSANDVEGIVGLYAPDAAVPMRARIKREGRRFEIDVIDVAAIDEQGRLTRLRAFFDLAGARPFEG